MLVMKIVVVVVVLINNISISNFDHHSLNCYFLKFSCIVITKFLTFLF